MDDYDTGLDDLPAPVAEFDAPDAGVESVGAGRTLTSVTEARLEDAGILHSRVGLETVPCSAWKRHREAVADTVLFDYLLADSVRVHLALYRRIYGYDDVGDLLAANDQGDLLDCPSKVATTWEWLQSRRVPTSPAAVRRRSPLWSDSSSDAGDGDGRVQARRQKTPDPEEAEQRGFSEFS